MNIWKILNLKSKVSNQWLKQYKDFFSIVVVLTMVLLLAYATYVCNVM